MDHTNQQHTSRAPELARQMAASTQRFVNSLSPKQRGVALFPFGTVERYEWHYTPVERNGLLVSEMSQEQRRYAFAIMNTGYSERSWAEATGIIALESVLGEWEEIQQQPSAWPRSSGRYWFSVFGNPGGNEPWGFRVGGHHIGLCVTVVAGDIITANPLFLGANPATIMHGSRKGERTLAAEEDLARLLLAQLTTDQKRVAIVSATAPADILSRNYRSVDPESVPNGILFNDLGDIQRTALLKLIKHYTTRFAEPCATAYWRNLESNGWGSIGFAWAGTENRGDGHYYAVKGNLFLIEYDNTQNNANHIHSVLRDYKNDWGEDALSEHYRLAH